MSMSHQPGGCVIFIRKEYDRIVVGYHQGYAPKGNFELEEFPLDRALDALSFAERKVREGYSGVKLIGFFPDEEMYKGAPETVLNLVSLMRKYQVSVQESKSISSPRYEGEKLVAFGSAFRLGFGIFKTHAEAERFLAEVIGLPGLQLLEGSKPFINPPRIVAGPRSSDPSKVITEEQAKEATDWADEQAKFQVEFTFAKESPFSKYFAE